MTATYGDDLQAQQAFEQLTAAVARVTHDVRTEHDGEMSVEEAIALTRAEVDFDDLQTLVADGTMRIDLAAAYATILEAADEDLSPAVTSHADGILDGQFGSAWWEPGDEVHVAENEDAPAACTEPAAATAATAAAAPPTTVAQAPERPYPWLGGSACEPASARGVMRAGLTPTRGHSAGYAGAYGRGEHARWLASEEAADVELSIPVVVEEHQDASVACANAAASVAQLVQVARLQGYHDVVGVVVVEDVTAPCDEDGGF